MFILETNLKVALESVHFLFVLCFLLVWFRRSLVSDRRHSRWFGPVQRKNGLRLELQHKLFKYLWFFFRIFRRILVWSNIRTKVSNDLLDTVFLVLNLFRDMCLSSIQAFNDMLNNSGENLFQSFTGLVSDTASNITSQCSAVPQEKVELTSQNSPLTNQ